VERPSDRSLTISNAPHGGGWGISSPRGKPGLKMQGGWEAHLGKFHGGLIFEGGRKRVTE